MDTTTSGPEMAAHDASAGPDGPQAWRDVLFKTGRVLFVAGLVDVAVMVACIVTQTRYSSMLNIFAAVAGWFLMKESLRAAHVVRWIGVFALGGVVVTMLVSPWQEPWGLTWLRMRSLGGVDPFLRFVHGLAAMTLLAWAVWRLGRPEVLAARAAAGLKRRDLRIPLAIGVTLALAAFAGVQVGMSSDSAKHAEQLVREKFGDGYRYRATYVGVAYRGGVTTHRVTVTVYNDTGFQDVPVQWTEPEQ